MKSFLLICVLLAYLGCSLGQVNNEIHDVVAYCTRLMDTNQIQLDFTLALNTDPVGAVSAVDSAGNDINAGCTINYAAASKIYTMMSVINLSNNLPASNGCGYTVAGGQYTWKIAYYELPNQRHITIGKNRVYTATCNLATATPNREDASISISSPDIDQTVTPSVPPVKLYILYEVSTGNFIKVNQNTPPLTLDTNLKLQLEVDFGTFSPSSMYGAAGLLTQSAGRADFSDAMTFFNNVGCPANLAVAPNTLYGFLGPAVNAAVTSPFVATTGSFRAWLPESSVNDDTGALRFRVFYDGCTSPTYNADPFCRDPCQNQRNKRRRREAEEEIEPVAVASVRIINKFGANNEERQTTSDSDATMMYVSISVAAVVFVALVIVVVCALVFMSRRRRRRSEKATKVPPEGFVNNVQY